MFARRLILLCALSAIVGAFAAADTLHLRDGRVIEADTVWERDGDVWYRQGGMIASIARSEVLRVTRPIPSVTEATPESAPATKTSRDVTAPTRPEAREGKSDVRRVTRILLHDGTRIDADAVWESEGNIVYRLGNMHALVERGAVAQLLRNLPPDAPPPPPRAALRFTTGHAGLDQLIERSAAAHGIDPLLIYFVMREESGFNHRAVSRAGARGLMQLMPATAARLGVRRIHDPVENVAAGTRYLRTLLDRFGDVRLALAAYNAGEDAVARFGNRIPPYRETVGYVRRISAAYLRATK